MLTMRSLVFLFGPLLLGQDQTARLTAERAYQAQQIRYFEALIAAQSFADRSGLFCRNAADNALLNGVANFGGPRNDPVDSGDGAFHRKMEEMRAFQQQKDMLAHIKHGPIGGLTLEDLRTAYKELEAARPVTREGEALRQREIAAINKAFADYQDEFAACRVRVTYGDLPSAPYPHNPVLPLPTNEQLRDDIKTAKDRIAVIDRTLQAKP
jgi:hypothetical protein